MALWHTVARIASSLEERKLKWCLVGGRHPWRYALKLIRANMDSHRSQLPERGSFGLGGVGFGACRRGRGIVTRGPVVVFTPVQEGGSTRGPGEGRRPAQAGVSIRGLAEACIRDREAVCIQGLGAACIQGQEAACIQGPEAAFTRDRAAACIPAPEGGSGPARPRTPTEAISLHATSCLSS
jgi:hypothetical protein